MAHYLPGPHHVTPDGRPIWRFVDDRGDQHWVVQRAEGWFFSDFNGNILRTDNRPVVAGAAVGAALGAALGGPTGAILGALLGGVVGKKSGSI